MRVGPKTVFGVVFDGGTDFTATAPMIQAMWPWISFLYCQSHGISLTIKDCFKEDGGIKELTDLDTFITDAQFWFSTHAMRGLIKQIAVPGDSTTFVWPACTRYCGLLLKIKRFRKMRDLLRRTVNSGVYVEKNFAQDPFKEAVLSADVWQLMDRVIKILGPLLLLCRLADGQKPVMSKLYGTQLYVRKQIEDIAEQSPAESIERKICAVFLSRWDGMQSDVAQAAYCLDPLFVDKSKDAAGCIVKLWQLARKVNHIPPCTHTPLTHSLPAGAAGD